MFWIPPSNLPGDTPRSSQASQKIQSLQCVLGLSWGLLLVEYTQNTWSKKHPGGILVRCPNELNCLFTSSSSNETGVLKMCPCGQKWPDRGTSPLHWMAWKKMRENLLNKPLDCHCSSMVAWWLALMHHNKKILGLNPEWSFICSCCIFFGRSCFSHHLR